MLNSFISTISILPSCRVIYLLGHPVRHVTHSAFKLSLTTAASSLGNCMCFVEQSDTVIFTSLIIMRFLSGKNSKGVWRHVASL